MVNYNPVTIRATDDEALATKLWGDGKEYNERRQQWMPKVEGGEESSPGKTSSPSSEKPETNENEPSKAPRSTARTTAPSSSKGRTGNSSARSTGGSGTGSR